MTKSGRKGTAGENTVVDYLNNNGFPKAERRRLAGAKDKGDVAGVPGVVIEVKNEKSTTLSTYVDEASVEAANAGEPVGVAWHKRRGKTNAGEWYVSMSGEMFMRLLSYAHAGGLA